MILKRLLQLRKRQKMAKQLGIKFKRCKNFVVPENIILNGIKTRINLPKEDSAIKVIFIELLDDCYGCQELEKGSKPINKIVDIGANVGLFGIIARSVFPKAVIHAYEPNPHIEQYLKTQAQSATFKYFMEAVGLENGKVKLNIHDNIAATRSQVDEKGNISQVAFRKTIERIGGAADLVKMDCEGAEWKILQDYETWQSVSNLSLEYHLWSENHTHDEVRDIIQNLGFVIKQQTPISNNCGILLTGRY